jgi:hypothetical protein
MREAKVPLVITRDDAADTVTIDGQTFTADFFRFLRPEHAGTYFELFQSDQGLAIRDLGPDPAAWLRVLGKIP